jgi:hypothetical protein
VSEPLATLATHELRALAAALRGGRLAPPFTALATGRFVAAATAQHAAAWLDSLAGAGASGASLALVLDAIADDRERRAAVDDAIDLVSTGPETPAAANRDTRVVVSELFATACTSVLVVGYAVYNGRQVFRALGERMEQLPELDVRMFLDVQRPWRDTTLPEELLRRFARRFKTEEWPGTRLPRVYYDPRSLALDPKQRASLHAKCIVIDSHTAFISSANFTAPAQLRNIEIGLLVRSRPLAERLAAHFDALAEAGHMQRVPAL